jgi:hypothetical protein
VFAVKARRTPGERTLLLLTAVDGAATDVRSRLARLDARAPRSLHKLRIALKHFRYIVEIAEEVSPSVHIASRPDAARRSSARLGQVHDADVLLERLDRFASREAPGTAPTSARSRRRSRRRAPTACAVSRARCRALRHSLTDLAARASSGAAARVVSASSTHHTAANAALTKPGQCLGPNRAVAHQKVQTHPFPGSIFRIVSHHRTHGAHVRLPRPRDRRRSRLLEQSYRLRHQVYCMERQFLDAAATRRTRDRRVRRILGAPGRRRLVRRSGGDGTADQANRRGFPMFRYCAFFPEVQTLASPQVVPVEVSRVAISRHYPRPRRRTEPFFTW